MDVRRKAIASRQAGDETKDHTVCQPDLSKPEAKERYMTFRTIDTDMASVGATTESDITMTGVARRTRSVRRAAIRNSRMSSRVWVYSKI